VHVQGGLFFCLSMTSRYFAAATCFVATFIERLIRRLKTYAQGCTCESGVKKIEENWGQYFWEGGGGRGDGKREGRMMIHHLCDIYMWIIILHWH
jgi:hypothetical protein